ncbi:hypothetical protein AB0G15_05485 [Streptosporangium sp. NPDC023825]|uniref:hypothetical protein n=1 Tax=Streptosporangium sp. NPDC023825 TaxID=3154909 RepID=UPI00341AFFAE
MATIRRHGSTTDAAPTTTTNRRPANRHDSSRPGRPGITGGRGALARAITRHQETKVVGGYKNFKLGVDEQVFAFADSDAIASYFYHWVNGAEGRKSFLCLDFDSDEDFIGREEGDERKCPLCKIGDKKIFRALFNVIALPEEGEEAEVSVLECGITLAGLILDYAESERIKDQGGLNGPNIYWEISRKESGAGDKKKYTFNLSAVKERDLMEDFGLQPLTAEQREELQDNLYTADIVRRDTYEDLEELVSALHGR